MSSTAEDPPAPCFLLKLPPELRNRIFELVLIQPHRLYIANGQSPAAHRALLATCRQIYLEATGIFYSANFFGYHSLDPDLTRPVRSTGNLISWLKRIGSKNRTRLTDIRIWLHNTDSCLAQRFHFLVNQNSRLGVEGVWLPLTVLRVKVETEYMHQAEVAIFARTELLCEREEHSCWKPKDPSIRNWTLVPKQNATDDDEDDGDLRLCVDCDMKRTMQLFPCYFHPRSPPAVPIGQANEDSLDTGCILSSGLDDLDTFDFDSFLNEDLPGSNNTFKFELENAPEPVSNNDPKPEETTP